MKKTLLYAAFTLGIFAANSSFAQTTANATFNVVLEDIMSIEVLSPTKTVTFNDVDDYQGVYDQIYDFLSVTSTKAYKVTVKAGDVTTNPSSIALSTIKLAALRGDGGKGRNDNTSRSQVSLSTTDQNLIVSTGSTYSSANNDPEAIFDLDLTVGADGVYYDKTAGTNVIPVVFTITAP